MEKRQEQPPLLLLGRSQPLLPFNMIPQQQFFGPTFGPPPPFAMQGVPPPPPFVIPPFLQQPIVDSSAMRLNQFAAPFVPSGKKVMDEKSIEKSNNFKEQVFAKLGIQLEKKQDLPTCPQPSSSRFRGSTEETEVEDPFKHYTPPIVEESNELKSQVRDKWKNRIGELAIQNKMEKVKLLSSVAEEVVDFVTEITEQIRESLRIEYQRELDDHFAQFPTGGTESLASDPFNTRSAPPQFESAAVVSTPPRNSFINSQYDTEESRVHSPEFGVPDYYNQGKAKAQKEEQWNKPQSNNNDQLARNFESNYDELNGRQHKRQDLCVDVKEQEDEDYEMAIHKVDEMMKSYQGNLQSKQSELSPRSTFVNGMQQFGRESPGFRSGATSAAFSSQDDNSFQPVSSKGQNGHNEFSNKYENPESFKVQNGSNQNNQEDPFDFDLRDNPRDNQNEASLNNYSTYNQNFSEDFDPIPQKNQMFDEQSCSSFSTQNNYTDEFQTPPDSCQDEFKTPPNGNVIYSGAPPGFSQQVNKEKKVDDSLADDYFKSFDM